MKKYKIKKTTLGVGNKHDARSNLTLTNEWQTVKELTAKMLEWIKWGEAVFKEESTGTSDSGSKPVKESPKGKESQKPGKK